MTGMRLRISAFSRTSKVIRQQARACSSKIRRMQICWSANSKVGQTLHAHSRSSFASRFCTWRIHLSRGKWRGRLKAFYTETWRFHFGQWALEKQHPLENHPISAQGHQRALANAHAGRTTHNTASLGVWCWVRKLHSTSWSRQFHQQVPFRNWPTFTTLQAIIIAASV